MVELWLLHCIKNTAQPRHSKLSVLPKALVLIESLTVTHFFLNSTYYMKIIRPTRHIHPLPSTDFWSLQHDSLKSPIMIIYIAHIFCLLLKLHGDNKWEH
jgi:hypothetical protein